MEGVSRAYLHCLTSAPNLGACPGTDLAKFPHQRITWT